MEIYEKLMKDTQQVLVQFSYPWNNNGYKGESQIPHIIHDRVETSSVVDLEPNKPLSECIRDQSKDGFLDGIPITITHVTELS